MRLGEILKDWRTMQRLTLREAAAMMQIGFTTLMRIEHGYQPEGKTLRSLLAFMLADGQRGRK